MNTQQDRGRTPAVAAGRWHRVALRLMVGGGAVAGLGLLLRPLEFGYAWLLAYLVCLSLPLGALFLVMMHHLFDAGWSVPMRRTCEHLAGLSGPVFFLLWLPIGLLATQLYPWMRLELAGLPDLSGESRAPLFTIGGFYVVSLACFAVWHLISGRLRAWSVRQDENGAAECTHAMRRWSAGGLFLFAVTLTLAAILWMKALNREWFSSMFGVCYFSGSVWFALANVYGITLVLERTGRLRLRLDRRHYSSLGTVFFAFTLFYAYIHFSQYFIIWNANVPEETFWYRLREEGSWYGVGILLIFGHFFLPFVALLRRGAKHCFPLMVALWGWSWGMHFVDMAFNILPVAHPEGVPWRWLWLPAGCLAFIAGLMLRQFRARFGCHAPYPIRDPRLAESLEPDDPQPQRICGGGRFEPERERGGPEPTGGWRGVQGSRSVTLPWQSSGSLVARVVRALGAMGAFLLLAVVVLVMIRATRAPAIDARRVQERYQSLREVRLAESNALHQYTWQDRAREIVRLPIDRALELTVAEWQNPAAARSNLIERVEKATAPLPNPYE